MQHLNAKLMIRHVEAAAQYIGGFPDKVFRSQIFLDKTSLSKQRTRCKTNNDVHVSPRISFLRLNQSCRLHTITITLQLFVASETRAWFAFLERWVSFWAQCSNSSSAIVLFYDLSSNLLKMASGKSKTIEEIDDLSDMIPVMAALGISCKGLKTLDEMKTRVKKELNQSVEKPGWTAGQVRTLLLECI